MPAVVGGMVAAGAAGRDVAADTYAYTAWANDLSAFVPPWAHAGGTDSLLARLRRPATRDSIRRDMTHPATPWDDEWLEIPDPHSVLVTSVLNPDLRDLQGVRLDSIAARWGEDPIDAIFDLLLRDRAATGVAVFAMSEKDVRDALRQPWVSIDTDYEGLAPSGLLGQEHPHPRAYATFPRILRKYVREEGLLSLPEAIRKFSALPAQRLGLEDRGVLRKGMWADVVAFDPDSIRDRATFEDPNRLSEGIRWVLVNGVPVIADGAMTGRRPGRVLRGPGWTGHGGRAPSASGASAGRRP
jgi:N-acyl-D-amino-acid deacylase